jgi:hypothetical protein
VRATSGATNRRASDIGDPGGGNLIVPSLAPSGLGNPGAAVPGFAFAHPGLLSLAPPAQSVSQTIVRPTVTETHCPGDPGSGNSGVVVPGFAFAHPGLLSLAPPAQSVSQTIVRPTIAETRGPGDPGGGNLIVPSLAASRLGNPGVAVPGFAFAPPAQSVSQTIVGRSIARVPGIWAKKRAAPKGAGENSPG